MMLPGEAREFTPKERDHGHDRGSLDLEEDEDDESADSTGVPTLEDELYMGLPRRALFFLDLTNPVRHAAIRVVRSKLFERTILFIIMANCAFLAMSSNEPNFDNTTRGVILNKSEAVFTALFLAEMLLKVLAMGFVLDKGSYLREPWNVMDCVVVFLGLLAFIPSFGNYSAIRTVRVLRPLRTITGVEGMRVLVVTLLRSLPMLIDVLVLCAFAFFIFGIIGVQSFATKLRNRCGVESTSDNITFDYAINALNPDEVCSGPMAPLVGPDADRSWGKGYTCPAIGGVQLACFDGHENPNYGITNFDNILYAWLTIFQCISMEGWTDIMYLTQDATNSWVFLYFVVLIIFGSFFAVNLALAVLYMHFTDTATASHEASAAAAEEKRDTARAARKAMKAAGMNQSLRGSTPVPVTHHHNPISRTCRHVTQSRAFTYVMLFLILVNTAVMAMQYYGQSARMTRALNIINYFLTAAFALEMILKLIALGPRGYVRDKMNIFDGLVVFFSILEVCISTNGSLSVLRAFRLLRVFKLARSWKQLNSIINTIFRSVGSISYLSLILLLFIFVFALLGMQLFGYEFAFCDVGGKPMCPPGETCLGHLDCYEPCTPDQVGQYDPGGTGAFPGGFCERYPMSWVEGDPEPPGGVKYLTFVTHSYVPRANFDDIYWSIITIFQVLTGENWNEVMYNGIRSTGYPAAIYFLLLVLVGNYVILNLFLAILLDNFGGGGIQKDGAAEDSTACTPRAGDESTHGGDRGGYDSSRCTSLTDKKRQEKVVPQQDDKPGGGDPGMNCNNNKVIGTSVRDLLDPKTMAALSEEDITAVDEGSEKQASVMAPPSCPPLTIRTSVGVSRGGSTPSDETVRPLALVPAVLAVEDATPWADSPSSAAGQRPLLSRQHKVEYIEDVGELPVHGKKKSRHGQAKIVPNGNGMLAHHVEEGKGKAGEGVTAAVSPRLANGEKGGGFGQGVGSHKEDGHSKGSTPGHPDTRSPTGFFSPVASPRAFTPDGNSPSYAQMHGPSAPGSARQLYPARSFHSQRHNSPHAKQLRQKLLQQRTRFRMNLMPYPQHSSLYIFASTNPMRAALYKLICHRYFEIGIVLVIAASSIVLTLDSPRVDPDSTLVNVLDKLDLVFLILFIAECVIKIIVLGFVLHPGAYLRSAWNVLDFLIVVIGVVSRASGSSGRLSALRALRTFRALRPIRMASRAEGMKVVVNALFQAIPSIGNVLLVCALFYLIFGILGMDLLAGRLQYCEDVNGVTVEAGSPLKPASWPGVVINRTWCETGPHLYNITREGATVPAKVFVVETHWHNRETNFDNIGHAALALFEMASLEGWLYIMYSGVDAVGVEAQPRRNGNQYVAAYFVVFIIVGCFFVMNLFVGVTIDKFNEIKEKQEGQSVFLTPEQRNWVTIQKLLVGIKPIRCRIAPVSNIHRICYDFVSSDYFETGILGVIILNVIMMSMQHADMTPAWEAAMIYSNLAFCVIFTIEAALKLYGFSPAVYFKENWNRFDFGVVILTILSTLFDMLQGNRLPVISLIRVLRVVRIFRLVPRARGLRTLFQTLVFSLPALVNVGSVLSLFFFIFSIMGMNLFGQIKHGDYVTRHANFETFPNAMLLLFRMSTGENWNGVMHDCMITRACIQVYPPFIDSLCGGREYVNRGDACLKGLDEDRDFINRCSPHPSVAIFFFIIFIVLCAFVMLNLVIAVILDNFHSSSVNEEAPVSREHMQRFADVWSILDPRATYYISTRQLQDLIRELDPPLGTRGIKVSTSDVQRIIMSVDIPEHRGRVHFLEVLHALAGRVAGTELPEDEEVKIRFKIANRLPSLDPNQAPRYTAAHYHAALYVQAAVRGFLARYELRQRRASLVQRRSVERKKVPPLNMEGSNGQSPRPKRRSVGEAISSMLFGDKDASPRNSPRRNSLGASLREGKKTPRGGQATPREGHMSPRRSIDQRVANLQSGSSSARGLGGANGAAGGQSFSGDGQVFSLSVRSLSLRDVGHAGTDTAHGAARVGHSTESHSMAQSHSPTLLPSPTPSRRGSKREGDDEGADVSSASGNVAGVPAPASLPWQSPLEPNVVSLIPTLAVQESPSPGEGVRDNAQGAAYQVPGTSDSPDQTPTATGASSDRGHTSTSSSHAGGSGSRSGGDHLDGGDMGGGHLGGGHVGGAPHPVTAWGRTSVQAMKDGAHATADGLASAAFHHPPTTFVSTAGIPLDYGSVNSGGRSASNYAGSSVASFCTEVLSSGNGDVDLIIAVEAGDQIHGVGPPEIMVEDAQDAAEEEGGTPQPVVDGPFV